MFLLVVCSVGYMLVGLICFVCVCMFVPIVFVNGFVLVLMEYVLLLTGLCWF